MLFGNMGYGEVIIIVFLALLLFGAKRLPEIGSSLGKSIRAFKKSVKDLQEELPSQSELYRDDDPVQRKKPEPNKSYSQETSAPKTED